MALIAEVSSVESRLMCRVAPRVPAAPPATRWRFSARHPLVQARPCLWPAMPPMLMDPSHADFPTMSVFGLAQEHRSSLVTDSQHKQGWLGEWAWTERFKANHHRATRGAHWTGFVWTARRRNSRTCRWNLFLLSKMLRG